MASDVFTRLCPVDLLSVMMWGEARGEPLEGRVAVGCVARNRANNRGQSLATVILQPNQFSCFSPKGGGTNYVSVMDAATRLVARDNTIMLDPVWHETAYLAAGIVARIIRDNTGGADHYMTRSLFYSPAQPRWAAPELMVVTLEVGRHVFLRSKT